MKPNAKMQQALDATLAAYDRLIERPGAERGKWEGYSDVVACRLCRVDLGDGTVDCKRCPLGPEYYGCRHATMLGLANALKGGRAVEEVTYAARKRRAWVKEKAKKNGFRVVKNRGKKRSKK